MLGDVIAKVLVILAGLIACGACAASLFGPAVEEADEEGMFESVDDDRGVLGGPLDGPDAAVALPDEAVIGDGGVAADGGVTGGAVVAADVDAGVRVADEPERVVVPALVVWAVLLVGLVLTAWAVMTPAASLARPALIAGCCVLIGVLIAWVLGAAGASDYPLPWTALAAWVSVGLSLIAAWLIVAVLSTPGVNEAVPA